MSRNLYEITFKVGRKTFRWCRFSASAETVVAEIVPAFELEYNGKAKIIGIVQTSIEAEERR